MNDMTKKTKLLISTLTSFIAMFWLTPANALDFTPSEREWIAWGEMCQARYVVSGAGLKSIYQTRVPKSVVNRWREKLGKGAWYALHHYCAGIHEENRGKLGKAKYEYSFTFARMPVEHYLYTTIGLKIANVHYEMGEEEQAFEYVNNVIQLRPNYYGGYALKGIFLNKKKAYKQVIETLELGNTMTKGESAELNYHLGLAYLKVKDYEKSKKYALQAYNLGYQLPGLKHKLTEVGAW